MSKITITEGLGEIKVIQKRIMTKRQVIMRYLGRGHNVMDPMAEKNGGSPGYIRRLEQSVRDLEARLISIRTGIQRANLENELVVHNLRMTVAEWLTWRRELSGGISTYLSEMVKGIKYARESAQKEGGRLTESQSEKLREGDVVINVNEAELNAHLETHQKIMGDLDTQLSLHNASAMIEITPDLVEDEDMNTSPV